MEQNNEKFRLKMSECSKKKRHGWHQQCCLGECKRDSRYADKWPKLLRVRGIGEKSIHTFPKMFVRHGKVQALASGWFA